MKIRGPLAVDWTTKVKEWVDADLISSDTASAIVRHEGAHLAAASSNPYEGTLSPLAEVLAYVAMIFTVASGATLVERTFPTYGARTLTLALVALASITLGARVMRLGGHAWERIGGVLLAFSTACSGGLAALLLSHYAKMSSNSTQILTALLVTTLSWALWRNRERYFQMLTTIGGLFWFIGSAIAFSHIHLQSWMVTTLFWIGGMLIVVLRQYIHPTQGALYMGMAVALVSAPTLLIDSPNGYLYGSLAGIATAGLGILLSHSRRHPLLFVVSVAAMFFNLLRVFAHFAHSGVALVAVFVVSVGAMVLLIVRYISSQTVVRLPEVASEETVETQ